MYGRIYNEDGSYTWVVVTTDANGDNASVYLTAFSQAISLNLGESPFWSNTGIPAQQSVVTQVPPDYYVAAIQQQFSPFFASLTLQRVQGSFPPLYRGQAISQSGAILPFEVAK